LNIRDLSPAGRRKIRPGDPVWLAARFDTELPAGPGFTVVELDLAIEFTEFDSNYAALIIATRGLLDLGLRAALPMDVVTKDRPVASLSLLVERAGEPLLIEAGSVIAQLLVVERPLVRWHNDPTMDSKLDPDLAFPMMRTGHVLERRGSDRRVKDIGNPDTATGERRAGSRRATARSGEDLR
jgi:hypothetical protein